MPFRYEARKVGYGISVGGKSVRRTHVARSERGPLFFIKERR